MSDHSNQFSQYFGYAIYLLLIFSPFAYYGWRHARLNKRNLSILAAAKQAGLTEPPSMHPLIDPKRCLACGCCVDACPEGNVLGMVDNQVQVINPTNCIGHGVCRSVCPHDAITLVFGSEKRGVDIPFLSPTFETNVPGIFIAGELGGMGLIRNSVEQGRQAIQSIKSVDANDAPYDVVIVGAGPAGFSASLAALESKLRYVTVEQETLGGTVAHFPRGKLVMTKPFTLPIFGLIKMRETTKEALLEMWQEMAKKSGVKINYEERMEDITPHEGGGYLIKTSRASYHTRTILLAIGRRGTPRKLDVPGEKLNKVTYSLIDAEQYQNQHVLVVGGGDAALEAATSIAEQPDTTVTLSYRGDAFSRTKEKNRAKVNELQAANRLQVLLSSQVIEIKPKTVEVKHLENTIELQNDAVIICAGGVLPTPFLKKIGIEIETKYGTA